MTDEMELDEDLDEIEQTLDDEEGGWDAGPFVAGLGVGAAVGAGLALLFAPAPGRLSPAGGAMLCRSPPTARRTCAGCWLGCLPAGLPIHRLGRQAICSTRAGRAASTLPPCPVYGL